MRRLALGQPLGGSAEAKLDWIMRALRQIEEASNTSDASIIGQSFEVAPSTDVRTFDPATVTHADLSAVVATLIGDMQKGGPRRS